MAEATRGFERKHQSGPDWDELIAPLRQAGRALGAAGELVRKLDDEATVGAWMKSLNELPSSITFHPFETTADWSVDLEREQPLATRAAELHSWSPALTRRTRQRQQFSVVDAAAAASPSSPTPSRRAAKANSALPDAPSPGTRSDAHVPPRLMPQTGAWSALLAIVQLVDEIESLPQSGHSPATPPPAALRQQYGADARAVDTAGTSAAAIDAPTVKWAPREIVAANATSAANSEPETATALLARYVAALWSGTAPRASLPSMAARDSVERAGSARPRAPSLLLQASTPLETPRGPDSEARAAGGSAPPIESPENDRSNGDALADRLNRELLEQAWLRGVDLT